MMRKKQWLIEATAGDDGSVDPWTAMEKQKSERVDKNKKQQSKNLLSAAGNRVPGTIDLTSAIAASSTASQSKKKNKQGKQQTNNIQPNAPSLQTRKQKHHVDVALKFSQNSTASMGRFDELRHREPTPKLPKTQKEDSSMQKSIRQEKQTSLGVLDKIMNKIGKKHQSFDASKAANIETIVKQTSNKKRKMDLENSRKSTKGNKSRKSK